MYKNVYNTRVQNGMLIRVPVRKVAMRGLHLRKRGSWWHYFRHRPVKYRDIEPKAIITFGLGTTCFSEAKLKAAQVSCDLDSKWSQALKQGISLSSASASEQYCAALEVNQANGFALTQTEALSDHELLNRLRYLVMGDLNHPEQKAMLGFVKKPQMSVMEAFDRFWEHIADEWSGHSHD